MASRTLAREVVRMTSMGGASCFRLRTTAWPSRSQVSMSQMATSNPSALAWATACSQLVTGVGACPARARAVVSESRTERS